MSSNCDVLTNGRFSSALARTHAPQKSLFNPISAALASLAPFFFLSSLRSVIHPISHPKVRAIPSIYLGCAARPFARRVRFDARRGRAADRRSDAFDWTIALKAFSDALQSSIPALPSLEDRGRGRAGRHGQNHGAQSHHPSSDYFIPYMVDGKPIPTTELWSRIVTQPNEKARCVCQYVHPTPPCPASASTARDDGKANSPMMMDAPPMFPSRPPRPSPSCGTGSLSLQT